MKTNMLLITVLGLIAMLASVSDGCDVGTREVTNFDWNQVPGSEPWYVIWRSRNTVEDQIDCVVLNVSKPLLGVSEVTVNAYVIGLRSHVTVYGFVKNWNTEGNFDVYPQPTFWTGRYYVIATDYDSYLIMKHCPFNLMAPLVCVSFRSPNPDEATVQEVKKKLQENNIEFSELDEWKTDQC